MFRTKQMDNEVTIIMFEIFGAKLVEKVSSFTVKYYENNENKELNLSIYNVSYKNLDLTYKV